MFTVINSLYLNSERKQDAMLEEKQQGFHYACLYQMRKYWELCNKRKS